MKNSIKLSYISAALFAYLMLMANEAVHAEIAGHIQFVNGVVQITNPASPMHTLKKGDEVHVSDTLSTAKSATAQIKMRDGGFIVVRPDSQLKIDSFVFNGKEDGTEQNFFSLIKGSIRAITGLIGQMHKPNYHVATLSTTIGVRGTDHEIVVVNPGSELAATVPAGTYNKVNVGETTMTTNKGTINILPNQMGFVGGMDQMPQLKPVNQSLFNVTPQPSSGNTNNNGTVRDNAAMDNAIQVQDAISVNSVPKNQIQTPIKTHPTTTYPEQTY